MHAGMFVRLNLDESGTCDLSKDFVVSLVIGLIVSCACSLPTARVLEVQRIEHRLRDRNYQVLSRCSDCSKSMLRCAQRNDGRYNVLCLGSISGVLAGTGPRLHLQSRAP